MKPGLALAVSLPLAAFVSAPTLAQPSLGTPIIRYDSRHDVSATLREMARTAPRTSHLAVPMPEPGHSYRLPSGPPGPDGALQETYLPTTHTVKVLSFDAVREDEQNAQVPDTNGAVGDTQFVEITNFDYAVYDKSTGKVVLNPTDTDTIFQGFGGRCENTSPGDPVVVFDKIANRWLVSYFNYVSAYALCIAVSTSDDATGSYNRYEYDYSSAARLSEIRRLAGCLLRLDEHQRRQCGALRLRPQRHAFGHERRPRSASRQTGIQSASFRSRRQRPASERCAQPLSPARQYHQRAAGI